jgi:hypothetical protein
LDHIVATVTTRIHLIVSGPDVVHDIPSVLTPEEEEKSLKRKWEPVSVPCL